MTNFREYDCIVDGTMEQCIEEIELGDLENHIHFGPQADVMELLTRFNSHWGSDLEITKTFKWKRGSYDKVTEIINKYLGFRRRPSGMYNFLSREDWFRTHSWNRVRDELRAIDSHLYDLRYNGEIWLEDPSVLIERKNLYMNYMVEKSDMADEIIRGVDIMNNMYHQLFINSNTNGNKKFMLVTTLRIQPDIMKIYMTQGRNSREQAEHIENIACDLDLYINIITYPLQTMIKHSSYDRPMFSYIIKGEIEQHDEKGFLYFPFISSSRYHSHDYLFGSSVCYGDEATNFNNAFIKYDLPSIVLQSINWATTYTNITGPHNNIKMMYHGEPAKLSQRYRDVFGTNSVDNCNYAPNGLNDYCDTHECALRAACDSYKSVNKEPLSPQEVEQMTIQWATRMGGVNTSTGNIHGGEMPRTSMEQAADAQEPIQGDREQFDTEAISQTVNDLVDEPWPDESPQGDEM